MLASLRFGCMLAAMVVSLSSCVGGSKEVTAQDKERLRAYVLDQPPADIPHRLGINYDNKVTLLGYGLEPRGAVRPGESIKLTMYWQCKAALDDGWNLFTHVLDGSGERILNIDNVGPLREWRETRQVLWPSAWEPGKVYVDEQEFAVPAKVKTRTVQVVTGVWKGNERLPIAAGPKDRENRGIVANIPVRSAAGRQLTKNTRVPRLRVDRLPKGTEITIDAVLNEPAWKDAPSTGPLVDVSTGEVNRSPDLGGWVKLLWDEQHLYLGFDVRDTNVVGGFDPKATDPHLWTKDTVEIMVDPDGDGDNRDYYEIQIGPQNLVFDSRFDGYNQPKVEPNGPFGHQDWSAQLQSAVIVRGSVDADQDKDRGYVVEARIPWTSFDKAKQVPPRPGDDWRMNFYIMQSSSGVSWSPILGQGNFHKASRFGHVLWAEPGWKPPSTEPGDRPEDPQAEPVKGAPSAAPGKAATIKAPKRTVVGSRPKGE